MEHVETKVLPDKPSALIRLALEDMAKCEEDPDYEVEMSCFHLPNQDCVPDNPATMQIKPVKRCLVCLAGSVMAQTLGAADTEWLHPADFRDKDGFHPTTENRLQALDAFRVGVLWEGLELMGLEDEYELVVQNDMQPDQIADYHHDPERFVQDMEDLAANLETVGL